MNDFEIIVGSSDDLSEFMGSLVNLGFITKERAFEIKAQLTEEYNSGKVSDEQLENRLSYLMAGIDFKKDVGVLVSSINSNAKICPYCLQDDGKDYDYCDICGYDLTHGEKPDFSDAKIVRSFDDVDISNLGNIKEIKELSNILSKSEGYIHTYCMDDVKFKIESVDIDIFCFLWDFVMYESFQEACEYTITRSGITLDSLLDILISKKFIKKAGNDYDITDKGFKYIILNNWMNYFNNYLLLFNFDDFRRFYENSPYGLEHTAIKFVDKHVEIAHQRHEFDRLCECYSSRGKIYDNLGDFEKSLFYDLYLFVLKLNPLYMDKNDLLDYEPLDKENIDTLLTFNKFYDFNYLKEVFNNVWDSFSFDKVFVPKKDSLKILKQLVNGKSVDSYSSKISKKYFN